MTNALIFGSREANAHYTERRAAYVVIVRSDGHVATVEFTGETCVGTGEHKLSWLPVAEAERAMFHACHAWAVRQV